MTMVAGVLPVSDVKESGLRAERWWRPVGCAVHVRLDERAFGCRNLAGNTLRPALVIEAVHPVDLHVRLPEQELARRAIEHVHQAVAIGPQHHLPRPAPERDVRKHGHLRRVVIQFVVRRELVVPLQLARVGIERDDAVAVQVVAKTLAAVPVRCRIARAPERQVRLGVVRRRHSRPRRRRSSTSCPTTCRCRARRDQESCRSARLPCRSSRRTRQRWPRIAHVTAGGADDHLVLHDQRRVRDRVAILGDSRPSYPRSTGRSSRRSPAGARRSCP